MCRTDGRLAMTGVDPVHVIGEFLGTANRLERIAGKLTRDPNSSTYYRVLGAIRQFGAMTNVKLAQYYRISQPGMSRVIATLERDGLVSRRPDSRDSRAALISITDAGNRAYDARLDSMSRALLPTFGDLSEVELQILRTAITIVESRLHAGDSDIP
jgi:DNA-binding MarR family transcriptional regulator